MADAAPASSSAKPLAVVIGSGFGGLAAAIRLGARGYHVTVLEKLDAPGGRAYVHHIDGFSFDAGPTIITAPFLLEELWQLCGRRFEDDIDLRPMDPFYRIRFDNGDTFDTNGDAEAMREQVRRFSPEDVEGYERFLETSKKIFDVGFKELGHLPFTHWTDMARIAPKMVALQSYRSVYSMVSSFVKDERLRVALSFHPLLIGGNPLSVTSIYTLISYLERHWGVHSAMGGTGAIVDGMVKLINGQGGSIRYNTEVAEITTAKNQGPGKGKPRTNGVRLTDGDYVPAEVVVCNADVAWTYQHLLPSIKRRHWTDKKLKNAKYSNGLFVWYFGTKRQYPEVKHHSILLGPRYRGLLDDIFNRKVLAEDFSLYLHRPTATDPSLAPEGCDTFYALAPVPHLGADVDWDERTEPFRAAIAQYLENTVLPGLSDAIAVSRVTTPKDFERRLLSTMGAGFSLEPVLLQSAWFRPHNLSEEVDRLYFVGAGTHPGAGLPGVISSARVLDRVVPDASVHS
ncbi:phytoene desaturase [Thiorhodovibrio frisius]|uniref:Phytoene dehydrogenase n=1 Tax=Thiorhodovibrio frisius TaxID=631362 RepID=H8YY02_9GAMM|nr:phytoene desaturase [Thiorhodovibrio frisius]EIC23328.1 phytoene desaturase [Thiorhodovibrio frisius]WPL23592.1 phytoene dehydrogenase [Thiorhodovibrio frisius]